MKSSVFVEYELSSVEISMFRIDKLDAWIDIEDISCVHIESCYWTNLSNNTRHRDTRINVINKNGYVILSKRYDYPEMSPNELRLYKKQIHEDALEIVEQINLMKDRMDKISLSSKKKC